MVDPKFVINLKGKDYPTWPGILDAATKAGLRSLTTTLLQAPSPENNHTAIVQARAEFDDGRTFEDLGDASPANCSQQIATAAIRMASTRAKGRVLRDAINVGQTMFEELPDLNGHAASYGAAPEGTDSPAERPSNGPGRVQGNRGTIIGCEQCGQGMTPAQSTFSQNKYQRDLCNSCQKGAVAG